MHTNDRYIVSVTMGCAAFIDYIIRCSALFNDLATVITSAGGPTNVANYVLKHR